jgi:hypothetical protein
MRMGINQPQYPPGDSIIHLVGPFRYNLAFFRDYETHVAGCARGCGEIFSHGPGDGLEIPFLAESRIYVPVFTHFVDLISRDIWSLVTF